MAPKIAIVFVSISAISAVPRLSLQAQSIEELLRDVMTSKALTGLSF